MLTHVIRVWVYNAVGLIELISNHSKCNYSANYGNYDVFIYRAVWVVKTELAMVIGAVTVRPTFNTDLFSCYLRQPATQLTTINLFFLFKNSFFHRLKNLCFL
jgi:hypothetical protein